MRRLLRILLYGVLGLGAAGAIAGGLALAYAFFVLAPKLPEPERLRDVHYQEPLRVLSSEGALIAKYGQKRRSPVDYEQIPPRVSLAFIAAEDDRFFEHPGVDYQGILRAVAYVIREQEFGPGGSTITMQVARNFFLSREQTLLRKANEMLLALQIEQVLSKEEILELYLNKIYLGNRAYGVAAAAQVYYGKPLDQLTVAEAAMIAGLPKAPSALNPLRNPEQARARREYVLDRMRAEGFISAERHREAVQSPLTAQRHAVDRQVEAPYVAEMVRRRLVERYGREQAYTGGYTVYTTLQGERQRAANRALRAGLRAYARRHGYRGPERRIPAEQADDPQALDAALREHPPYGGLEAAVVVAVGEAAAWAWLRGGEVVEIPFETMAWARERRSVNRRGPAPEEPGDVVAVGDIVRVAPREDGLAELAALPEAEGAVVALSPEDGRIRALSGGFDFQRSPFNRAVQARRQPGSAFKPYIYSAALARGYTPATLINDAPVVFQDSALEGYWRPDNYTGRFHGPTRMRQALIHSRNLVSIRILRDIGIRPTLGYLERFGFEPGRLPKNLSLALGSNSVTPLQMAAGYAVFANGGYRVVPDVIERIEDAEGRVVFEGRFPRACEACRPQRLLGEAADPRRRLDPLDTVPSAERAIPAENAWLMTDMLRDVVARGTGRGARRWLERDDLAGKTGTTNDQRDAWFVGFTPDLAAAAWVGYDDSQRSLGARETGAAAALPVWARFMAGALEGVEERTLPRPDDLVTVRIDPETGKVTGSDHPDAIFETFREGQVPPRQSTSGGGRQGAREELF